MSFGIKLHVWGERACFTRPELKVERVSYDVMTPSAARGILEAIHWKPAVAWVVDRIHVLNPVRFETIRRNEIASRVSARFAGAAARAGDISSLGLDIVADRQQRTMLALRDVAYVIEAHVEMTARAGPEETPRKHCEMFLRRAGKGQCFHRPYLGVREFAARFEPVETLPQTRLPSELQDRDLGWMLYDIDYAQGRQSLFFHAVMKDGVIDIAAARTAGLAS